MRERQALTCQPAGIRFHIPNRAPFTTSHEISLKGLGASLTIARAFNYANQRGIIRVDPHLIIQNRKHDSSVYE